MKIKYPTWKVQGSPTPNDALYVCDKCGSAQWGPAGRSPGNCHCTTGRKGGPVRMRKATMTETVRGKAALKEIIGAPRPQVPVTTVKPGILPQGVKPLYVLKFVGGSYDGMYYSRAKAWQGVTREEAHKFTSKEARQVQGHLKQPRIALATILEPAN